MISPVKEAWGPTGGIYQMSRPMATSTPIPQDPDYIFLKDVSFFLYSVLAGVFKDFPQYIKQMG